MSDQQQQQQQRRQEPFVSPAEQPSAGAHRDSNSYVQMENGRGDVLAGKVHFPLAIQEERELPPQASMSQDDEEQGTYAPSILSSVLTADGISDPTGFFIVCLVILIGDMSRGAMFPTMWNLVDSLGGDKVTLGYAVAAFSFGRILVSPLFGSWSVTYGYSLTLTWSCSVLLLGELCYAQIPHVRHSSFLIVAQILLGIGSGTLGVTRAFVADVTPKRNRTTYMAWLTAVQYGGFTMTPFVGSFFAYLFRTFPHLAVKKANGWFILNEYTCPAYFMFLITLATLVAICTLFQDRHKVVPTTTTKKKSKKRQTLDQFGNSTLCFGVVTVYDACILGCMLLNVATKGSIASFETLGIAFAQTHFDLYESQAGTIVATCGTLGVVSLLSMGQFAKVMTDVQMIIFGMVVMAIGVVSLLDMQEGMSNPTWRYILAIFMIYAIGYPIGHTAVIGLFSKIVGRRPQGTLLGWFASAGSLARMSFPIMSGYVAQHTDMTVLLWILIAVLGTSVVFTLYAGNTLTRLSS